MKVERDYCFEILPKLLKIEGVASNCDKTMNFIKNELIEMGYTFTETNKGGIIVKLDGLISDRSRLLTAHADTLGAMVKSIKSNGRIQITPVGGFSPISVEGEYITIVTDDNRRYRGTMVHNNPSAHVNKDLSKDERNFENITIRLDEKVFNLDDVKKLGIEIGDFCFFDTRTEVTESGYIKSRHLDDKAGVACLLSALKYFKNNNQKFPFDTYIYFSNAEEVGNGLISKLPDNCFELVAVDMGALGEGQESDEYTVSICAKDSSGPFNYSLRKKIVNLAKNKNIPYKIDIYPFYGSDAAAALRTGIDAKHILFGPGVDASHSYERVHKDSLDATLDLIIEYIKSE